MTAQPDLLRSARFRQEREASWQRLDTLVSKTETRGAAGLSYDEARDLATCYRQAMNSLSVALGVTAGVTSKVTGIVGGVKGSLLCKVGNLLGCCGC